VTIKNAKKLMGFSPDMLYEKLSPELLDVISKFDNIILKDVICPPKLKD